VECWCVACCCQVVIDLLFTAHELISISKDGTVAFWELSSGECTRSWDVSSLNPGPNTRLHLSADGCRLVVDSDAINSPVCIFDTKTGQLLHKYVVWCYCWLLALNETPSLSYEINVTSHFPVLLAIWHKWTHPTLTPAWFTYPGGMEGWVDIGDQLHTEMVYPSTDSHPWSKY